ncbi:forkhead box d [Sarcoptes scabiei]|nr:forkhead box d [Sarcoptes scabiei]
MQMKRFWQFPFSLISTNHMFKLLKKLILFSTILSFSNGFLLETKISSDDTFRLHSNEREAMRNFISGNDFDNIYDRLSAEERYVLFGSDQKNDAPSYQLIRFPHSSYDYHQKRRKRSTLSQSHSNEHTRLEFKAFDRIFRLFLWPNHRLLSPTFHLKHLDNQNDNTWMSREHLTDCFYQGHDEFDPESVAAISVCNGLQGVIETKPTIYIINPIPEITSRRLFGDNTNHSSSKYHLIIKQNTLSNYKCPHDSTKRISNKELDSSTIDSSDLLLTKQNIRKRSIEIDSYQENSLKQEVENSKQSSSDSLGSSSNDIDDNKEIKREENLLSKLERPDLKVTTISSVQKTSSDTNEIIDDEFQSKKTDYSYPFNITVETAVFIDESLYYALSKTFPIETEHQIVLYVLTIMNAVQLLFKQPSIGRSVDISVVLMDLLRQQPKSLTPSDNIDTYLTNFCVWQHKKRLREAGGPTPDWDHALLLSGINMYVVDGQGRRKRHVVGLAPVSGMCNSLNSCTISEGTTFQVTGRLRIVSHKKSNQSI